MPNSQSINQTLPNFATTKNSTSAPELKTNNNNFNQVLKNEVVNKAKKGNIEPPKNIGIQNAKSHAMPNGTSKTVIDEEKTEAQDTSKHDISDQEEQLPNNLSDPGSLLAFVNTVSALAQTSNEDATDDNNLTISGIGQAVKNTPLSAPIYDNSNDIGAEELIKTDQFGLGSDTSNNSNGTSQNISSSHEKTQSFDDNEIRLQTQQNQSSSSSSSIDNEIQAVIQAPKILQDISPDQALSQQVAPQPIQKKVELKELQTNTAITSSKADTPLRIDTGNILTAAHQVAAKDLVNSTPALNITERKDPLGLLQSPPVNKTSEDVDISTNLNKTIALNEQRSTQKNGFSNEFETATHKFNQEKINIASDAVIPPPAMHFSSAREELRPANGGSNLNTTVTIESAVPQQSIEITHQELPITAASDGEKFAKDLNNQLTQEKQDILKSMKSESQNELSLSTKTDLLTAAPTIPAPPIVMGSTTISEHISPRVGSKGWDQAIGQKIVWMVAGGEQSAQLTLNPPDLGPVQVVLSISDNFVDASFVSSHLDVREAIEAAAPKLREMMDNAGISLSGFSVSAESAQSGNPFNSEKFQHNGNSSLRGASATSNTESDSSKLSTPTQNSNREQGLVDTFA